VLGILAKYLNKTTKNKVLVVVPTAFLHAYQQSLYCPAASDVPEEMQDQSSKQIFYCSFDRLNAPEFEMPHDTILLVDEFHELFFNQPANVVNGKLVSVILKLKSTRQVIGVSATYRGNAGIKKISTILDASFIKSPHNFADKELQLQVFGEVIDIPTRAVQLAKEKSKDMPVIIFCSNPQEYK
jgi:hypothetical protein